MRCICGRGRGFESRFPSFLFCFVLFFFLSCSTVYFSAGNMLLLMKLLLYSTRTLRAGLKVVLSNYMRAPYRYDSSLLV